MEKRKYHLRFKNYDEALHCVARTKYPRNLKCVILLGTLSTSSVLNFWHLHILYNKARIGFEQAGQFLDFKRANYITVCIHTNPEEQ